VEPNTWYTILSKHLIIELKEGYDVLLSAVIFLQKDITLPQVITVRAFPCVPSPSSVPNYHSKYGLWTCVDENCWWCFFKWQCFGVWIEDMFGK